MLVFVLSFTPILWCVYYPGASVSEFAYKTSRQRSIYHVNIAHAQSARRTRTDGRTDARAVDIINGGARSRSPQLYMNDKRSGRLMYTAHA